MSKKFEPLSLEKELKLSYASKQQPIAKTLQISDLGKPIFHKDFHKKNSERLTDFNQKKFPNKNNPFSLENPNIKLKTEKMQNENININNQIKNVIQQQNIPQNQIIEINDLIGEKCDLDLEILELPFNNFDQSKTSSKPMGVIRPYAANT